MATFIAIPILTGLMLLQSGILSRIPLLHGTPDLLLLFILAWANRMMSQCCRSSPMSLAYSSQRIRHWFAVRHSSIRPYCFYNL